MESRQAFLVVAFFFFWFQKQDFAIYEAVHSIKKIYGILIFLKGVVD